MQKASDVNKTTGYKTKTRHSKAKAKAKNFGLHACEDDVYFRFEITE